MGGPERDLLINSCPEKDILQQWCCKGPIVGKCSAQMTVWLRLGWLLSRLLLHSGGARRGDVLMRFTWLKLLRFIHPYSQTCCRVLRCCVQFFVFDRG